MTNALPREYLFALNAFDLALVPDDTLVALTRENFRIDRLLGSFRDDRRPGSASRAVSKIAWSRAVSFSGGNAAFVALLFILFRETHSPTVVAVGALATFSVPALASPFAGWLGDRFDRRRVMVASELVGALCFVLSAAVTSSPGDLLILRVFASLAAAPLMSATAAALPGVVRSPEQLPDANTRLARAGIIGGLVGPLIGAGLIAISGPASVFLFNAATFLISAALLVSITADFRPRRDAVEGGLLSDLSAGFRYLGRHHLLRPVTLTYATIFVGVGLIAPAEVARTADFGEGATGFALLTCLWALGGIGGTWLANREDLAAEHSARATAILATASGVLAVGFLVVGLAPVFLVVLAGMTIGGAADGAWLVAHENLVQRVTPDAIRSRVFAGSEAVYFAGFCVGTVAAGGVIPAFGAARTFELGALAALLGCLLLAATAASVAKRLPPQGAEGRQSVFAGRLPSGVLAASAASDSVPAANARTR